MAKNKGRSLIIIVSIAVPVLVGVLILLPSKLGIDAEWVRSLPHLNATLNSLTSLLLLAAFVAVRAKKLSLHKNLMLSAIGLGAVFLVSYVVYHSSVESTIFGDANGNGLLDPAEKAEYGQLRTVYFIILLSHILLSIVVLPFVLFAAYFALNDAIARHKKLVRFAYPIWLYVSISGVIVYLLIRPFYG